ncbi:type III PLP-dependent enzyme [Nonomuraea sp. NPDC004297]
MKSHDFAKQFGTPLYVYDLSAIRAAVDRLRQDLPIGAQLFYSLKANPHPTLVAELGLAGCGAEVSSIGEMRTALAAGLSPECILYTGPGKSSVDLRAALAAGVRLFSVESLTDRNRLAHAAAECGVCVTYLVRLNGPTDSHGASLRMTGRPSPFGVDVSDHRALAHLLKPHGKTRPVGLHLFFATNVANESSLIAEFDQALETTAAVCEETGFAPELIDLGGGFAAPVARPAAPVRYPRLADALLASMDRWFLGRSVQLAFESGRYLVAAAGTLFTRVLDVKRSSGKTFAVLDAGVNVLGGMSGLGRLMSPRVQPVQLGDHHRPSAECITLVGPLCTPLDVLNSSLNLDAHVDDVLAIPNVGAYGLTASLIGFLSHPAPVEVVHDGGRIVSARRLVLQSTTEVNL